MRPSVAPTQRDTDRSVPTFHVVGMGTMVPCLDGIERPYINLDNAATTPPFVEVVDAVQQFAEWYSSVHRGTGYKSQLSTEIYEEARGIVGRFVGADEEDQVVLFTQHTTDSVNRLARRFQVDDSDLVLSTVLEHHTNMLPWGRTEQAVHVGLEDGGRGPGVALEAVEDAFAEYPGRIRLLAVSGASNVTGFMPPIHELAEIAHRNGAMIFVDAAQLVPHRRIDMRGADDPGHIDFLAFSAHKMYAPYGTGVLIGPRRVFAEGTPAILGGGAVDAVRLDDVVWTALPDREEAGTPNLFGVVALARACRILGGMGMESVAEHERMLSRHALARLAEVEGLSIAGDADPDLGRDRLAVFSFNLEGFDHAEVAAVLGYEHGIAVRNGCFCAQPYIKSLLGLTPDEEQAVWERSSRGEKTGMPGFVRASVGCYSTLADIDALCDALQHFRSEGPASTYDLDAATGDYLPRGYRHAFSDRFSI